VALPAGTVEAETSTPAGVTFRAVFIGAVLMLLYCFTLPYNDYKIHSTYMTGNLFPIAVVLILAILALVVNVMWRAGLLGGEEFLVALWGVGVALFGLVADRREFLSVLPLSALLVLACVAVRAWAERWKGTARRLEVLGVVGAGLLLFTAFNFVFPFFGIIGVIGGMIRRLEVPDVPTDFFRVSGAEAWTAFLLALDSSAVFLAARRAGRLVRERGRGEAGGGGSSLPAPQPAPRSRSARQAGRKRQAGAPPLSFDPAGLLFFGTYVAFGLYAVGTLAAGALNPVAVGLEETAAGRRLPVHEVQQFPAIWAFLGLLALIGLGVALKPVGRLRLAGPLKIALGATRGRLTAALAAGGLAGWLSGSRAWALTAAVTAALAVESMVRLKASGWRVRKRDVPAFAAAGAVALVVVVYLMVATHRWEWAAAAFGLFVLAVLGLADPRISGALDWMAAAGFAAGAIALAATGSHAAAILVGAAAAFACFAAAGSCSLSRSRGRSLARGELIVIFILLLAGSGIPGSGLIRYLHPTMVFPAYYAAPENKWDQKLLPHIPDFLSASKDQDSPVVQKWFEGYRKDELDKLARERERESVSTWEVIPWGSWVGPTVSWFVFLGLMYFMMLCLSVLLRKQWEEHERLRFPLVQVPVEIADDPPQGKLVNTFFRNRLVWIGAAIPIIVHGVNGLAQLNPSMPSFDLEVPLWSLFGGKKHWQDLKYFKLVTLFTIVGVSYILPLEVSFSFWFFYVFFQAQLLFGSMFNLTLAGAKLKTYLPETQFAGAYVAYTLFLIWTARHHIADVFRKVKGPWKCPRWGITALGAAVPVVFLLSLNTVGEAGSRWANWPEALAMAVVYALTVPVGMVLSRAAEGAPEGSPRRWLVHLNGLGTLSALVFAPQFGWSAFAAVLPALVEARRLARSPIWSPGATVLAAPLVARAIALAGPTRYVAVTGAQDGAYWPLAALVAGLAVLLPWFSRRRLGLRAVGHACQGTVAIMVPVLLCRFAEAPGWLVAVGLGFFLLGPVPGFLRDLLEGAKDVDDSKEGMSYRTAFMGLVGAAVLTAHLAAVSTGMSFGLALASVAMLLMVFVLFSRVVAQGGLPFIQTEVWPSKAIPRTVGPRLTGLEPATGWGAKTQVMSHWVEEYFMHDMRETAMPSMMNSFKMGEEVTRDRRRLLWIIVLSVVIAATVSSVAMIYLSYTHGGTTLEGYGQVGAPRHHFSVAVKTIDHPEEYRPGFLAGMGWGVLLTGFVVAMASRFYWWPFHPIGLLVYPWFAMYHSVLGIFIGWFCKTAIWRFGGEPGVAKMRAFFLGLILGDCLIGGVWIVAGLVMGQKILSIMPG
jgi:hypothetical protein